LIEYVDKMLKTSRLGMFAPSPRQNRGCGVPRGLSFAHRQYRIAVGKCLKNKGLWPNPSALSHNRQTRYELAYHL
jgi:hypothetical protein